MMDKVQDHSNSDIHHCQNPFELSQWLTAEFKFARQFIGIYYGSIFVNLNTISPITEN
jgi:hypothetical protein